MKKHSKMIVPFLAAVSVMCLASCGQQPQPGDSVPVESISLNRLNVALAIDKNGSGEKQSFQLESSTLPRNPVKATIKYSSLDNNIASVDSTGRVTANNPGETSIIAKSFDGKVETSCKVYVYETMTKSQGNKVAKKIQSNQAEQKIAENLDKIYVRERLSGALYKNGVLQNLDKYDQYMYVGKKDAYLRIGAQDEKQIKVEGGSASFSDFEYIFYTTEDYDTYIFHTAGNTKNYLSADSTSFVGQSRFKALSSVLESFFVAGASIVTSQYEDVIGKDELGMVASSLTCGSNKDGELFTSVAVTYPNQVADAEDESDMNIPAGTNYDLSIAMDIIFEDNVQYSKKLVQSMDYVIGEDHYSSVYDIEYEYHVKDVEFLYPDRDDYVKVQDIFEL